MPPNRHAVLSASSSHRWLHCNPSARLELEFEDRETDAAAEGTAAHALAEHKLRKALKMRSTRPVSKYDSDEMEMYTDSYLEFVLEAIEEARQDCPDPKVLIEQRLDFSCYVPDGFGTGDCLIVADKLLHIIDLKYGQGVLVNAEENPQMMLYALGALRIFDCLYDIETVSMTIYQPRRENVSTWVISVAELRDWAEKTLKPKAELAFKGEGECETPHLDEETIKARFVATLNAIIESKDNILEDCRLMQATLTDCTGIDTEIKSLLEEIDVVTELTKRCIAENSQTAQNQEEYTARYNGFVERYEKAKAQLEQLRTTKAEREAQAEAIGAFMFEVQELDTITEFDEKLWLTTIDTVTVHADGRMTFKFQGGTEIEG